jgi:hypothetical protein
MKKLFIYLVFCLLNAVSFAQGFNVQVCAELTGPAPSGPVIVSLYYYDNLTPNTITDTINIAQTPYTHCFQNFLMSPDTSGAAYLYGTIQFSSCQQQQPFSFSAQVTSDTMLTTYSINCNSSTNCSATLFYPGNNMLIAIGNGQPPYSYSWDGGVNYSPVDSVITMTSNGTYCVIIMDAVGCTSTHCYTYTSNPSCEATISVQGSGPYDLTAMSQGVAPISYSWSTGDTVPNIVASTTGWYCLYMSDATGCIDTSCIYLTVNGGNCSVQITEYNNIPNNPNLLVVDSVVSGSNIIQYIWQFNNALLPNATGPTITPNAPGLYCVSVIFADSCVATNCYQYNPGNPVGGCSVVIQAIPDSTNANLWMLYSMPTGIPPFTYSWLFSNGDTASAPNVYFGYANNYGYNWAQVIITDSTGCQSSYSVSLPAANNPLICQSGFNSSSLYQPNSPGEVIFESYLFNANASGVSYTWDFGDGGSSSLPDPTHTYTASGFYYVCLITSDASGCSNFVCNSIYIDLSWWNGQNPLQGGCTANFMILPNQSNSNGMVDIINLTQGNHIAYTWLFGNGFLSNSNTPFTSINSAGIYPICLTIVDTVNFCSDTFCDTITIDSLGNVFRSSMTGNVGIRVSAAPQNGMPLSVSENGQSATLQVIPNPANDRCDLFVNMQEGNANITCNDILGKNIFNEQATLLGGRQQIPLDISGLEDGTYLIRIASEKQIGVVRLIIKR